MPTQQHIFIGLISNFLTAPLELIKVRGQLLQEGRKLHGWGFERGAPTVRLFNEVVESGAGLRGLWTGFDSLFARSLWYGGFRSYFWCLFYNYFNKDPRRTMPWPVCSLASFLGGFCAGVINNPIDLVYNRQAADALLPGHLKRGYTSFFDGLSKVHLEGSLMRGAIASGVASGVLLASMSNFYDYLKEYLYWFFGPTEWLRPLILLPTAALGTFCYLPFDNIKVRMHNMTTLPSGELPYKSVFDAFCKIFNYEASIKHYSSILAFHTGFVPAFIKLYTTLFVGIKISDIAFRDAAFYEGALWEPATVYAPSRPGYIPHEANPEILNKIAYEAEYLQVKEKINLGPGTSSNTKGAKENKDYLSKIKKENQGNKEKGTVKEHEDAWDKPVSDDEVEEQTQLGSNIVKDQGKVGGDQPKSLKELLGGSKADGEKKLTTAKPKTKQDAQTKGAGDFNKPRFINSTGVKNRDTPLNTGAVKSNESKKPVFSNSKGGVNNNIPLNPNAKPETKKEESLNSVKDKIANTKTLFQKTLVDNNQVKAPKKDYLEGDIDVKYKEEVEDIQKPVFHSNKESAEPHFIDINTKEDLFLKNLSTHANVDNNIVYSTPKEDRENHLKKDYKHKRRNDQNYEKKGERKPKEEIEESKPAVEYDSDGFEIISEKKQTEPKRKIYKKREFDNNNNYNGDKKKFNKKENEENQTKTSSIVITEEKPKEKVVSNLGKVAVLDMNTQVTSLKDLLK